MSSDASAPPPPAPAAKLAAIPLQSLYAQLAPVTLRADDARATFTNWGLSYTCTPLSVFEPETEEQCGLVLELARREGKTVRVAGIGHSPSDLACTTDFMLRTTRLNRVLEVDAEKHLVVAQAGVILSVLHDELAHHGLAMRNLGSISDQTLGGVVTTATHGSGMQYPVLSMDVKALVLLLADGSRARCSREENPDLFLASICGLGSTGLILEITLEVEPAFRLKEVQESHTFDDVVGNLDSIAHAAEHVRLWWFPHAGVIRVSSSNRTSEPRKPVGTWLWHSVVGFHLLQFLLFIARYIPALNLWIGRFMAWLVRDRTVTVDDSHRVFNIDCKPSSFPPAAHLPFSPLTALPCPARPASPVTVPAIHDRVGGLVRARAGLPARAPHVARQGVRRPRRAPPALVHRDPLLVARRHLAEPKLRPADVLDRPRAVQPRPLFAFASASSSVSPPCPARVFSCLAPPPARPAVLLLLRHVRVFANCVALPRLPPPTLPSRLLDSDRLTSSAVTLLRPCRLLALPPSPRFAPRAQAVRAERALPQALRAVRGDHAQVRRQAALGKVAPARAPRAARALPALRRLHAHARRRRPRRPLPQPVRAAPHLRQHGRRRRRPRLQEDAVSLRAATPCATSCSCHPLRLPQLRLVRRI